MVSILGIPYDDSSSYLKGPALGPDAIRKALHNPSSNLSTESGLELHEHPKLIDQGNVAFFGEKDWLTTIEESVHGLLQEKQRVLSLGGDHSITYPIIKAFAAYYETLTILHLDAHPDLYNEFEGNRYSHACPFARIMESGLAQRLVQVGIRTMTKHQRAQANKFGVEVFEMSRWEAYKSLKLDGPVYLSVDLDVLDPAFAPGVSHKESGGLTTRELLGIIQGLDVQLVGADIVELNPRCDLHDVTAMVGAKIMKEIVSNMIS